MRGLLLALLGFYSATLGCSSSAAPERTAPPRERSTAKADGSAAASGLGRYSRRARRPARVHAARRAGNRGRWGRPARLVLPRYGISAGLSVVRGRRWPLHCPARRAPLW